MSSKTVGDQVLERLQAWGVRRVFGYPGDGINGVVTAFPRVPALEFVQARHEELAAFMACAHAKFTGEVGVCLATSGPGAIHLLNGLYDAKADHQPVVAIVGQQARMAMGGDYQQEVDLAALFKDVAHEFVQTAMVPAQVRHLIDRAMRIARDQRTVTCVILPNDLQEAAAVETPPREHGSVHSGIGVTGEAQVPDAGALQAAADVLNAGQRVAILVGAGALQAGQEVIALADRLGAGIAKALLGKAVVPDDLPFVTGAIGLLGTEPSWALMQGCDTLLMVGTSFPYSEYLPKEGQARAVQIDLDNRRLGLRYPTEVNLVGDSRKTLQALLPLLQPKSDRAWRQQIEAGVDKWWRTLAERAASDAVPINPQRVFHELSPRLPDDAIVCCDSGTSAAWYARDLKFRQGMMGSVSGGLASMGCALPYALAAKLAYPGRPALALLGDGAMQMLGLNALVTIAHRWKQWADPRLVVLVLNNGDLNMVTWEQRGTTGAPRFDASQLLPGFPYADYARLLGLGGLRVERPEQVTLALEEALGADRPVVLDLVVDPNVLPIPPHVTPKQAKASIGALLKGDPEALSVVKATAREWWASVRG
ncbi:MULTISPECIES: thiamine pyrophosphate-requiring protein [Ramlibacter]|uniref:Thiamine pyrophosphate-requiring protein n=1 Tax=Ramlibacter pinisoli TaxID=2682844 RepID=A0A6N8IR83_9BURK|nr:MULTISPECIES: thiamine pyrophosphate-requiring protein [Ramlibacter]MBA2963661.1 thiamine pyrophosphate-requiring protein [Ramlibacter sp. CGMCC 1.13660]MVQ28626.1 thiamine pyrophosphate-requiring protein [Ramlibacter pinisoli]